MVLLVSACVFFAGFNYLTYANAEDARKVTAVICDKSIDADCDGLTESEEKLYGTDDKNSDTDGDSYSDGVEVKSGYDPTRPAPGDKISNLPLEKNSQNNLESFASTESLTDNFTQDLKTFIDSKGGTPISNNDVNTFVAENLASKVGEPLTFDSLPEVDVSSIKVLDQSYPLLSDEKRKEQLTTDSSEYFTTLVYLILSNSPRVIATKEDLTAFNDDFLNHVVSLTTTNPDYEYFSDLGDRLDLLLSQLSDITVPETIVPIHVKMIRLTKGFLALRDTNSSDDPISNIALISKIQALTQMSTSFLGNDVANYFKQF